MSKKNALAILAKPFEDLKLSSDYYKAASCLENFPGNEAENALINLIQLDSQEQSIQIAQRKSIEVLGRFKSIKAIPYIFNTLKSNDPYIVENSVLVLSELTPTDPAFHDCLIYLLDKPCQNQRVLIQVLAKLKVTKALPKIKYIFDQSVDFPNVRGAAIAALYKLNNQKMYIHEIRQNLLSHNQNDRQSAVQDVIDSGCIDLLPQVVKTPVSPFFRLRAVNILWNLNNKINNIELLDSLIIDHPKDISLIHSYDQNKSPNFLINEFYNTDFGKAYLALINLSRFSQDEIWPYLYNQLSCLRRDYGAIYFVVILFRLVPEWDNDRLLVILDFLYSLIDSSWPDFMKFRPATILTLIHLNSSKSLDYLPNWLDYKKTSYWASRYAALVGIEVILSRRNCKQFIHQIDLPVLDVHPFIRQKSIQLCNKKQKPQN